MIELREVVEGDLEVFYRHQADPEASAMAVFPSRDRDAHFAHWGRILGRADVINRTVLVDGVVAGSIGSWEADGRRLVGYWIGRDFWGRGVATAALGAFAAEVTERPLFADVAESNGASIRVLEKCGFRRVTDEPHVGEDGVRELLFRLG